MNKKIGFIGLGRMGSNMVLNLVGKGYTVVGFNRTGKVTHELRIKNHELRSKGRFIDVYSLGELVEKLVRPRVVWIMVKAGEAVDETIKGLLPHLSPGDIIIDGGNDYFENSIRRYQMLKKKGIEFLDCGTSGGLEGARNGACLMVGGDKKTFSRVEELFCDLATAHGYAYVGKSGAGHFVKMVHNGIEYGMMGALAEGMQVLFNQQKKFKFDLSQIVKVYNHGSIVEGRLTNWLETAWRGDPGLSSIDGVVPPGETEAKMEKLEKIGRMEILKQARLMRVKTRKQKSFAGKILAALRNQFGGHKVVNVKSKIQKLK